MTITKSTGRGPSSDALRISIDQRGAILHGTPRRTPSKAGQGRSLSSPLCFGGSCVFLPKRSKPKSQVRRNRDGAKKRLLLSDRPPGLTRPGTSKRVVVMTEAHMTYLVIFSGKFIQIHPGLAPKRSGPLLSPRRSCLSQKRPWSLDPVTGQLKLFCGSRDFYF